VNKTVVLGIIFLVAVVGLILYTTLGTDRVRCEVCITYKGRTSCRAALGSTEREALRMAIDNACALIASGVTDSIACQNTPPDSVRCE
jgi:hypothetical protein